MAERINGVRQRISAACMKADRDPASVQLIAASKTFTADAVACAAACGLNAFGENYYQEASDKIPLVAALTGKAVEWHFIGPIQGNKTSGIAAQFDWVHGIEREKIATRLSAHRPTDQPPLQVLVQVNISGEASKSGCHPDEALGLCKAVAALPGLRLRGLMAIPSAGTIDSDTQNPYLLLADLFHHIRAQGLHIDTISAGMSGDLETAVSAGSTMVRIGSAIFGPRIYSQQESTSKREDS